MSDRAERLSAALADLEQELDQLADSDPETRALLQSAAADISRALQKSATQPTGLKPADTAQSRNLLEQKVLEFEASHPQVSSALSRFIDMLGQIGI